MDSWTDCLFDDMGSLGSFFSVRALGTLIRSSDGIVSYRLRFGEQCRRIGSFGVDVEWYAYHLTPFLQDFNVAAGFDRWAGSVR